MAFIDEQSERLLKKASLEKKYNSIKEEGTKIKDKSISELSQEEIIQAIKNGVLERECYRLNFENKSCFNEKLVIPILKGFFDQYEENDRGYCWVKKHGISILLTKTEFIDEADDIDDFVEKVKNFFKESEIYIEFLSSGEELNDNFNKYIIVSRMPIGLDYIYQFRLYIKFQDEIITLLFTCLEKDKEKWEKIMIGISELIEIN